MFSYPLVVIGWSDHQSNGGPGWETIESQLEWANETPPIVYTVGWIIFENEMQIVLVDTLLDETETGSAHKILKKNVVMRKELYYGQETVTA